MQPNDLPIVCLPLELSDEAATQLLDFLYQLTAALERHYAGQLLRHAHRHNGDDPPLDPINANPNDPPF
ncbi:MAG: hypothetical protein IT480_10770 [Gammaproteobacteria bacterium]|nr:hypothetical protein [Gammaproteobacteria bacterium]